MLHDMSVKLWQKAHTSQVQIKTKNDHEERLGDEGAVDVACTARHFLHGKQALLV